MTSPTDREEIASLLAELKGLALPSGLGGSYVASVIAETEADLAAPRLGPRRGRSIFELYRGAMRADPGLDQDEEIRSALSGLMFAMDRLPDYFPWSFKPCSVSEDPSGPGRETRRWEGEGWRLGLVLQGVDQPFDAPLLVPMMDLLGPWWLFDLPDRFSARLDLGPPRLARGADIELGFLPVVPGNEALAEIFTPFGSPGLNNDRHFAAFAGQPKPALFVFLADLIGEEVAAAPNLTVAEALLRGLWRHSPADLAGLFEGPAFTFGMSTGYGVDHLWLSGPA